MQRHAKMEYGRDTLHHKEYWADGSSLVAGESIDSRLVYRTPARTKTLTRALSKRVIRQDAESDAATS